ncbi:hypothetical protein AB4114_32950 [Paenibacillus sp. 2RAB27]|uniref:hypothetical protein n=1 Tax=Paenibacillus sp. 2RAB27 TaxID=3232991 RepID=UPI003F9AA133
MKAQKIRPFVPSGEDFALAVQFYSDLGFEKIFSNHQGAIFKVDETEFHLQNYHNVELQQNYMLEMCVQDIDAWWTHIQNTEVVSKYQVRATPPKMQPYGKRAIHLIDPAGVLWHFTE